MLRAGAARTYVGYIRHLLRLAFLTKTYPFVTEITLSTQLFFSSLTLLAGIPASNKYQLSMTNPRDALRHGKRVANKAGRSV